MVVSLVAFSATLALLFALYALLQSLRSSVARNDASEVRGIQARDNGGRYTKPYRRSEGL